MLQSAGTAEPSARGDDPTQTTDPPMEPADDRQMVLRERGTEAASEHIVLHEVGPADEADDEPPRRDHDPSDVAASLLEALDDSERMGRYESATDAPEVSKTDSNGRVSLGPGRDTAEDLAALLNTPWDLTPADTPPTHDQPDDTYTTTPPPSPTYHTADDLLADVHNPSNVTDTDITDTDSSVDLTRDPTGSWDTESRTKYSAEEWPWVGKSGDGGFWAPPADGRGTVRDQRPAAHAPDPATDHGPHDDEAQATGDASQDVAPPESGEEPRQSGLERLRGAFQELGAWTALAQVALLAVGMLCIIQVFVLIVVSSYLSDAHTQPALAVGSLDAHAKVDGVMLPALLAFAVIAFAFAAWRTLASRDAHSGGALLGRPFGLPMSLWFVLVAALVLLFVILADVPDAVPAAQRITQWAMFACALLGAACFAASRGLDTGAHD